MSRIGPGATGAVKAFRLVHREQYPGAFELDALLAQRSRSCSQRAPAARRRIVRCEHGLIGPLIVRDIGSRGREGRLLAHVRSVGAKLRGYETSGIRLRRIRLDT